ncbi:MAG: Ku protein [Pseudohongiella sp.]|nr:Ku protein [Pseudohongiella sp.]
MARSIWKGAISFGLVHIPVSLQSATSSQNVDFDWLDERTMDPVGYKRINKTTGKPVNSENIVKGVQYEKGKYVILSEEEIKAAHPKATQTIEIFAFVDYPQIPLINFRKPYFLNPGRRGEKVYALLRETLVKTNKVALAYVVIHTRQHLAALLPRESALVLMLLRWPGEMRSVSSLDLHESAVHPDLTAKEKAMAERLVEDMSSDWDGDNYRNTFDENIMALVEEKAEAGEISAVHEADESPEERKSADVIDLTELLKRSLGKKTSEKPKAKPSATKTAAKKPATKTRKSSAAKG